MNDFAKTMPFEEVAQKGADVYESIKADYESTQLGKFLAIEPDSKKSYVGTDIAEALDEARSENPGKLFYVVKIGFSTAETLAHSILHRT
jgi:hypothetical protein